MKKTFAVLALASICFLGCSSKEKLDEVTHRSISMNGLSDKQITSAIIKGGAKRSWVCSTSGKRVVRCDQDHKKFSASVDVVFDENSFFIKHVKTDGLKGKGVKRYNTWVENLKNDITSEIALAKANSKE